MKFPDHFYCSQVYPAIIIRTTRAALATTPQQGKCLWGITTSNMGPGECHRHSWTTSSLAVVWDHHKEQRQGLYTAFPQKPRRKEVDGVKYLVLREKTNTNQNFCALCIIPQKWRRKVKLRTRVEHWLPGPGNRERGRCWSKTINFQLKMNKVRVSNN